MHQLGSTTATTATYSLTAGTFYWFSVRANNSNTGYSAYAPNRVGYSSDIAIVYNDSNSTDTTMATTARGYLLNNIIGMGTITGTWPTWSVTLVPQSEIPATYTAADRFYGDPVIVTHGFSYTSDTNRVRLISAHGHSVIAIGYGVRVMDTINTNWATWGYTGQRPDQIGWGPSAVGSGTVWATVTGTGSGIWGGPVTSTSMSATQGDSNQMAYTANGTVVAVYRAGGLTSHPTNGWNLQMQDGFTTYAAVASQGRWVQYGYDFVQDRPYTGILWWVNLAYWARLYF